MTRLFGALILTALTGCAFWPSPSEAVGDKELLRDSSLARAAFDRGDIAKAVELYEKALNRARVMDGAMEIGDAAYNLALCHFVLGQLDQTGASLAEARAAFQRGGGIPADALLLEATFAHRQGRTEQALSLADEALSASSDEMVRFQVALLKGMIACDQGDAARAKSHLAGTMHAIANPALLAARERLVGSIFLLEDNPAAAAAAFDRAAAGLQEAKRYRAMELDLRRAAEAYRLAGDAARADERLMRAERSLAAQAREAR